jgi:hypothetical protein
MVCRVTTTSKSPAQLRRAGLAFPDSHVSLRARIRGRVASNLPPPMPTESMRPSSIHGAMSIASSRLPGRCSPGSGSCSSSRPRVRSAICQKSCLPHCAIARRAS